MSTIQVCEECNIAYTVNSYAEVCPMCDLKSVMDRLEAELMDYAQRLKAAKQKLAEKEDEQ